MNYRSEWRSGHEFAEFAEALGITTSQIMAAGSPAGTDRITVLYTAEADEHGIDPDEPIIGAMLARDEDRILRVVGGPYITPALDWAGLQARIEAELGKPDDHA